MLQLLIPGQTVTEQHWRVVADTVMGGHSTGSCESLGSGQVALRGHISHEDGGGFVFFMLGLPDLDLTSYSHVRLTAKGDGRPYRLALRSSDMAEGVHYQARFSTQVAELKSHVIVLADFVPTRRGRRVSCNIRLRDARISSLGLIAGGDEPGPFEIILHRMSAFAASA